ncbi:hypothetical protein [Streptomyces sp. NPDC001635]
MAQGTAQWATAGRGDCCRWSLLTLVVGAGASLLYPAAPDSAGPVG